MNAVENRQAQVRRAVLSKVIRMVRFQKGGTGTPCRPRRVRSARPTYAIESRFLLVRCRSLLVLTAAIFFTLSVTSRAAKLSRAESDFFETKIRPLFADNCYKCHSQSGGKVKGGLELDWKGGWQKGGDSGEAVIKPGDPANSLLIKAIHYTDPDLQMPPKNQKLTDEQIAALESWVKMGAPDPRTEQPSETPKVTAPSGKDHWSFESLKNPTPPQVKDSAWIHNDIDRFVLAKLEANGIHPNPVADKRTLIRRAYYDLIGLPPTPEQVDAFLADGSTNAFESVVDQLLASPHYGERWGRHWLDVARYSDTKGQFKRNRETSLYPYAWTYRDYVINAFNEDKPYNEFILEQLAADQLGFKKDDSRLAALGFLTVGDHFNGMVNDIINDRIDVTTKAFLGLTVSCARCHDHKFDPIPTADYYSLYGVFSNSVEPNDAPVVEQDGTPAEQRDYDAKHRQMESRLENLADDVSASAFGDYRKQSAIYLFALTLSDKDRSDYVRKNGGDPSLVRNWQRLVQAGARREVGIFGPWLLLTRMPDPRFEQFAPRAIANLERNPKAGVLQPAVKQALRSAKISTKADLAIAYGNLIAGNDPAFNAAFNDLINRVGPLVARGKARNQYRALTEQLSTLEMAHPGAPGRAMMMVDVAQPKDMPILIRGESNNRGRVVSRQFLEVLSPAKRQPFTHGSGRLDLARAIASTNCPLTARVIVNRVWEYHFGEGFVNTPDDLGNQSEPPSHPELLDFLVGEFMRDGWSLKRLHKEILMSATWQQSSDNHPEFAAKDPFNRLLWRANVRRLDFEPLRDSILYVGGQLDLTVGGKPVDLSEGTHLTQKRGASVLTRGGIKLSREPRRSVYGFVDRSDLLEMMNVFDFASPDMPTGKRYETTVPQQALFLMNSPRVVEQANNIVSRTEFGELKNDEARIRFLYELLFQREATMSEIALGKQFVETDVAASFEADSPRDIGDKPRYGRSALLRAPQVVESKLANRWAEYAQALLMTDEFSFVD
ncbi:DUF1549 domain-containing protein [bacterium]|nr:DUF1549 domain-containing protein [bacterium]